VMLGALLVIATASALTTAMTAVWQLDLLWGLVIGSATGAVSVPLAAIVGTRWFVRRRGLVTGIMTASNATGQLVFLPALAAIIGAFGWRAASWTIVAIAVLCVVPVVALLMRDRPSDIGLAPYGAVEVEQARAQPAPVRAALRGLRDGTRSGTFWLLCGTFFVCGASTTGLVGIHLVPAADDVGVTEVTAAGYLAAMGVFDIVGTTLSGWLTDRYDPRVLLFWYYGLRGLSLLALHSVLGAPSLGLAAFVVFYGLDWVATVPPTVALTAQAFGRERVGIMFGWIFACHQVGASLAALGAGVSRTYLGTYHWAFLVAGALCIGASLASVRIRPRREVSAVGT
jgi:sugar phosphate permease